MRLRGEEGKWDEQPCYDGCPATFCLALILLRDALLCFVLGHDCSPLTEADLDSNEPAEIKELILDGEANRRHCLRCDRYWRRAGQEG